MDKNFFGGFDKPTFRIGEQPQVQQPKKKGGIDPRAWISEIGGTIGGIGGGFFGGPAGAAAGAAGGTALGKVIEQKVKGEAVKPMDVATEAGLSALFTYGPIKSTKALLGIGTKGAAKGAAGGAVKGAFTKTQRQGIKQIGEAWGIDPGAKLIASGKAIGPQKANELQNFARKIGAGKTSAAVDVQDVVEQFTKKTGSNIKNKLTNVKTSFNTQQLLSELDTEFKNVLGTGGKSTPLMKDIQKAIKQTNGSYSKLWEVRKNIDRQLINFNKGTDLASTSAQEAAQRSRNAINKILKNVDGIKKDFTDYNKASDIYTLVAQEVKRPRGSVVPGTGLRVFGGTTQRVKSAAGWKMKGGAAEGITEGIQQAPSLLNMARRQVMAGGARTAFTQPMPGSMPGEGTEEQATNATGLGGLRLQQQNQQPDERLGVIRNAVIQDMAATGGKNIKNIQTIAGLYGIDLTPLGLQPTTGGKTGFAALTTDQQKRISNLNTVSAALDALEKDVASSGFFTEEPQALSTILGIPRRVIGGAVNEEQRAYIDLMRSRGIQIIRALGEVGNLSQSEQEAAIKVLPKPGDNAQTAQLKIKKLRDLFTDVAGRVVSPEIGTF